MASQPLSPPDNSKGIEQATTPILSSNASPTLSPTPLASPIPSIAGPAIGAGVRSPSVIATAPSTSAPPPPPPLNTTLSTFGAAPTYPAAAVAALETYKKKDNAKVVVRFKAIGNAPIMKNNHFRITAFNRFQAVIQFLRKELGWKQGDALFLYINSSFSPAPDDSVGNLFRCFGTEGHLIVNYSTQAAWG